MVLSQVTEDKLARGHKRGQSTGLSSLSLGYVLTNQTYNKDTQKTIQINST